mmetsp:Transcript_65317/g.164634  ORF Transcript_65317/g.164634 Transcript_65317/m.164634 type:complete len:233 (-) Transcript_65317:538-1236(-)
MAPPAIRCTSARRSRRSLLPRAGIAVAAGLAIGAAWSTLSASPGFAVGGVAVLERPSANADDRKSTSDARGPEHRKSLANAGKAKFNTTVLSESGHPDRRSQEVAQGPPWATCFVEYEAQGRPALEEWVMRGEQDNLNAFRSWREAGSPEMAEPMNVRCAPAAPQAVEEAMCIQCVSHSGASLLSPAGGLRREAVTTVQGQVVSTFIDIKQCVADTTDGKGFCMSGHVVVPV